VKTRVRLHLLLQLAALAAASSLVLVAVGIPLLASRALGPREFLLLVAVGAAAVMLVGAFILFRWVGRPLDRLLDAAARLGHHGGLPPLGPPGEPEVPSLARAALAFERTAAALGEERDRLAAKVRELEAANRRLAEAREGLLRQERLATVGRLAAGVAHEVGNPLGAITGYAELARGKHGDGGGPLDDYLSRISGEAARIDAIVRGLLDFARPSRLDLAPVALAPALEAAARLARLQGRCRDVALRVDLPPGLPAVLADERRLVQVLLNLLLNAGDAMRGRGEVRVSAAAGAAGEVVVALEDSGPGIPPEVLPRVFDPFFTTKDPGEGTGLGLAVCHGIMESFGGRIEAGAAAGGGARLVLWLRAAPAPAG
jgi:two-component system NtrC family sensor kinase